MKPEKAKVGPSTLTVAGNIARYRKQRGYTMRSFAEELTAKGFPISHSVISQMENGGRRIDVDELIILSACLGISPIVLLTPHVDNPDETVGSSVSDTATAAAIVINLYKISPEIPQWIREAITDVTGADRQNMIRAAIRIKALREHMKTDDLDLLLEFLTGEWVSKADNGNN
ncbi:MAG: helix-turn-helix transcriptional regulator [Corynebacterium glutamicum]|nr:helix-turn-helix transcriptional regulator [Corynebacterium glutamicum]